MVDPRAYLSPEKVATLAGADTAAVAPTWLPYWALDIEPKVFPTAYRNGFGLSWTLTPQDAARSPQEGTAIVAASDQPYTLLILGGSYFQGDSYDPVPAAPPPWPIEHGQVRDYRVDPDNERCPELGRIETDDTGDDALARVMWDVPGDPTRYYMLQLQPAPACSGGAVSASDLFGIAESVVSLESLAL